MIIARTDARAVEGLDGSLRRARQYREAGADVLFIEGPQSEEEVAEVARAFPGVPLLFNWAEGGKTPPMPFERLKELGYRILIFPISALLVATKAVRTVMEKIRADGTPMGIAPEFMPFKEFNELAGLPEIHRLEQRFAVRK